MTRKERSTLRQLYREARKGEVLLHFCGFNFRQVDANNESWIRLADYQYAHGITDEQYRTMTWPVEKAIYEWVKRCNPDLSVLELAKIVGYMPMPFFTANEELWEVLQTLCRRQFEDAQR